MRKQLQKIIQKIRKNKRKPTLIFVKTNIRRLCSGETLEINAHNVFKTIQSSGYNITKKKMSYT